MPRLARYKYGAWAKDILVRTIGVDAIAIDTETSGLGFHDAAFCATLTWRDPKNGELRSGYISLEDDDHRCWSSLTAILARTPTWIFHNAKFDLQKLILVGAISAGQLEKHTIHDTQEIWHLIDENERKALKWLAGTVLRESTNEAAVLRKVRRKLGLTKDDGFQHIPREFIVPYAMKDTGFTYRLFEIGMRRLEAVGDPDLLALYRREIDVGLVLLRMEANGLALDMPYLEATTAEYGARVMEGWQTIVDLTGKPDLNPQSPAQLKVAFEERGIYLDSTAVSELRGLNDELADAILAYRSDKKIHTTYLAGLLREQRDGLVHPWFNLAGARTGRMSSGSASN